MKFIQYVKDSFEELNNHMTWIAKEDAQKTTVTVAVFTI
ncbi:MAG: preprotein translocase subunit SecE, partial [Flavobacteriaceae bacterium]